MNEQSVYLVQAIRGPVILITIGVLFAFDRFTEFRFSQTWPVLLIVVGLLRLAGGPRRRYRDYAPTDPGAPPPPPPPSGNFNSTQYSSSPYAGAASDKGPSDKGPEARP